MLEPTKKKFPSKLSFSVLLAYTGLEVRRYAPVWYTGTSLVGLKSYRHFFLADCHTGMPYAAQKTSGVARVNVTWGGPLKCHPTPPELSKPQVGKT